MYSQLLPSASSHVRNKVNTSLRLEQIVWVLSVSCVGERGQILSVKCMYFVFFSAYNVQNVLNLVSLCETSFKPCFTLWYKASNLTSLCDTKVSNSVSLCDTKSFKPCITQWYKNFQTLSHSVIQNSLELHCMVIHEVLCYTCASIIHVAIVNSAFTLWTHGSIVHM